MKKAGNKTAMSQEQNPNLSTNQENTRRHRVRKTDVVWEKSVNMFNSLSQECFICVLTWLPTYPSRSAYYRLLMSEGTATDDP